MEYIIHVTVPDLDIALELVETISREFTSDQIAITSTTK